MFKTLDNLDKAIWKDSVRHLPVTKFLGGWFPVKPKVAEAGGAGPTSPTKKATSKVGALHEGGEEEDKKLPDHQTHVSKKSSTAPIKNSASKKPAKVGGKLATEDGMNYWVEENKDIVHGLKPDKDPQRAWAPTNGSQKTGSGFGFDASLPNFQIPNFGIKMPDIKSLDIKPPEIDIKLFEEAARSGNLGNF